MNRIPKKPKKGVKNGKILLYDEANLRFHESNYKKHFTPATTVILRSSATNKSFQGIPIHSLEAYKSDIRSIKINIVKRAKNILLAHKNHPVFGLPDFYKKFLNEIGDVLDVLAAVCNYLNHVSISCVVVGGSADYISRMLLVTAAVYGIPTICMQHGQISGSRGYIPVFSTKQAVYGEYEKIFYQNTGVHESRIEMIGHPRFDTLFTEERMPRKDFIEKTKIPSETKIVLIPTQITMPIDTLEKIVKNLLKSPFITVALRPHPNEVRQRLDEKYRKLSERYKNVKLLEMDIALHDTIANADVVCVYFSTTGLEAMLYGKPVVNIGKNPFDGAPYDICDDLVESDPKKIGKLIVELLTDDAFSQNATEEIKDYLTKAYPKADQLSGERLSNLIFTLTGIRSY